jgi:hypothetical protein
MVTLFNSHIQAEHFTCCKWGRRERVIYTDDERFVVLRTSWFTSLCCSCCERVERNDRTWAALRSSLRATYGEEGVQEALADPEIQRMMRERRSLTLQIFRRVINIADETVRRRSPTTQHEEVESRIEEKPQ